jgi:hypothetical protein
MGATKSFASMASEVGTQGASGADSDQRQVAAAREGRWHKQKQGEPCPWPAPKWQETSPAAASDGRRTTQMSMRQQSRRSERDLIVII